MGKLPVTAVAFLAAALLAAGCGKLGLGAKADKDVKKTVNLARPDTPTNRAVQVAWTAARAQYCAFGMDREKLRASYLAYERSQGLPPEQLQAVERTYDVTYQTFYARVRGIPNYCTKAQIEEIRPDINRHLRGDYTPSLRKPPPKDPDDVKITPEKDNAFKEYNKDPAQHLEQ